jgi:hypothetical protein
MKPEQPHERNAQEAQTHDPYFHEVAIFQQLIKERPSPFDLVRELLSNAAAREVGAQFISIKYFEHPDDGHSFEVTDDGCGMDFTGDVGNPGRLDRFLNLGLSTIVGLKSDEFSFKGMGSKLAYQSRRVEIETWAGYGPVFKVEINDPWGTLTQQGRKPNPRITKWSPGATARKGTTIRVYGHPPYRTAPFSFDDLYYYVRHRTFAGFTKQRANAPRIVLKALGREEEVPVGFSVLEHLADKPGEGTVFVGDLRVDKRVPGKNTLVSLVVKGLYTLDRKTYGLDDSRLNTGLVVSVLGIPYFGLELRQYAPGRALGIVPGPKNTCLVVECDALREELSISRSGLTDSEITQIFQVGLKEALQKIADSEDFRRFSKIPEARKFSKDAVVLTERQQKLQSPDQLWVWFQSKDGRWIQLHRKPENEADTLAVLWKLETTEDGLPFAEFRTLEHSASGADAICHIKEDKNDARRPFAVVEAKYLYYGIDQLGHHPGQTQHVICWDLGKEKREGIEQMGDKPWKFVQRKGDQMVIIYVLSKMSRIRVATEREIQR